MKKNQNYEGIYRHYLIRLVRSRPHLFVSILFGLLIYLLCPLYSEEEFITRLLISLNSGAIFYIFLAIQMMFFSSENRILKRAELQDEGQLEIFILVIGALIASLTSIVVELSAAKNMSGKVKYEHIALCALTIITSWLFTHLMFALHYAHDYYLSHSHKRELGLNFPGTSTPDYADFLYFAFIIGTSSQTADVCFNTSKMRRIGTVHCILSFFFNTTILALTINIASGLL